MTAPTTIPISAIFGRPINPPLPACAVGDGEADALVPIRGTFVPFAFIVVVDVEFDVGEGLFGMEDDVIVIIVVIVVPVLFITTQSWLTPLPA